MKMLNLMGDVVFTPDIKEFYRYYNIKSLYSILGDAISYHNMAVDMGDDPVKHGTVQYCYDRGNTPLPDGNEKFYQELADAAYGYTESLMEYPEDSQGRDEAWDGFAHQVIEIGIRYGFIHEAQ